MMRDREKQIDSKERIVFHLSAPGDDLGAGIADYCDKLVRAQRNKGEDSYFVISESKSNMKDNKLDDERYQRVPIWSKNLSFNEKVLEGIEKKYSGRSVVWHINLAPPVCGPIVSTEWLGSRNVMGTIHECKIPGEEPSKDDPNYEEKFFEYNKVVSKSKILLEYAKTLKAFLISNETEANYLKDKGVDAFRTIQSIPPNLDPRVEKLPKVERKNVIVHFGMIRAKKGIEDVINVQKHLDETYNKDQKKIVTELAGKVTIDYFGMFQYILKEIYGESTLTQILDKDESYSSVLNYELSNKGLKDNSDEGKKYAAESTEIIKLIERTILKERLPKIVNLNFHPNASEEEIFDLLNNSKIAYLPFDRGATFHSGTLPACILSDNVIISTKGQETPLQYLQNLILKDVLPDDPSSQEYKNGIKAICDLIVELIENNQEIETCLDKQNDLKSLYPEWSAVAQSSIKLMNNNFSQSKEVSEEKSASFVKNEVKRINNTEHGKGRG